MIEPIKHRLLDYLKKYKPVLRNNCVKFCCSVMHLAFCILHVIQVAKQFGKSYKDKKF